KFKRAPVPKPILVRRQATALSNSRLLSEWPPYTIFGKIYRKSPRRFYAGCKPAMSYPGKHPPRHPRHMTKRRRRRHEHDFQRARAPRHMPAIMGASPPGRPEAVVGGLHHLAHGAGGSDRSALVGKRLHVQGILTSHAQKFLAT